MANILNTRIQLKYDSFTNWKNNNPTLLSGEVAIVYVESTPTQEVNSVVTPQILFKVGPGAFNDLPWASGRAADVYNWAKQSGLSISKDGTGNVVSGIEWDATANNGKGGIKFTTASVATSEGLENVQGRLAALEAEMGDVANDYANSRIDILEKTISDNQANWEKDDDTTYTFAETTKGFSVTPKGGSAQTFTFNYLTQEEIEALIPTELGVMSVSGKEAIVTTGDDSVEISLKIDSNKGNVELTQSNDGLKANVDLAALVPGIKVDNAGHADSADNATKLNGQEASHYATAQSVTDAVGRISSLETSVGNLSGAFQFKGTADALEELGSATDSNVGFVYIIGDLEYVSDGHNWIQLGDEGSFVLKTTYQAHLETQAEIDKGQSDKIKAIEDDIKANRDSWASKTSVTDPIAGDGKITVDGTELTVYDDSALKTRVQNIEDAYISTVNGKTADDSGSITLTASDIEITLGSDTGTVQESIVALEEVFRDISDLFDADGRAYKAVNADQLGGHNSNYFATAEGLNDATGRISTLEDKKLVEYYEATEPNLEEEVYIFYCGSSDKLV